MIKRVGLIACALSLFMATGATAQKAPEGDVHGVVAHVEPSTGLVRLADGRELQLEPGATIWIDGRPVVIGDVKPGSKIIVRSGAGTVKARSKAAATSAHATMASSRTHPPVDAIGTVSSVDHQAKTITFEDGRTFKLTERSQLWHPVPASSVQPGAHVFVDDAVPAGFKSAADTWPADSRLVMGTVVSTDASKATVLLQDGTVVRISPKTKMHMGRDQLTITQLQPGDQVVIRVAESGAATASASTTTTVSGSGDVSALARQGVVYIDAEDIRIMRRQQAP
jgi:hypothetical protein